MQLGGRSESSEQLPNALADLRGRLEALRSELPGRLRELRRSRGLSQNQVAEQLTALTGRDYDPTAVTRVERGQRSLRFDEAWSFAVVLEVSLETLAPSTLPLSGERRPDRYFDSVLAAVQRLGRIAATRASLDDEEQTAVADVVRQLALLRAQAKQSLEAYGLVREEGK